MGHREHARLARPFRPQHEPVLDYGRGRYNNDTAHSCASPDYGLDSGFCGYYEVTEPIIATSPQPPQALCTVCMIYPQSFGQYSGAAHAYCSMECAVAEDKSQRARYPQYPETMARCRYPGCVLPATLDPDDSRWDYCSQSHKHYALNGCIYCRKKERSGENPLCQACDNALSLRAPILAQVPSDNKIFQDLTNQFAEQWSRPTRCPKVHAVYRIIGTRENWDEYYSYRDRIEHFGQFVTRGRRSGNEHLLWHGTRRMCNLGDSGNTTPCQNQGCALCLIIRGSFDVTRAGVNTGWMRFGAGIYTSTRSSKADDYSRNLSASNYKVVLLNNVAVGKVCELFRSRPTWVHPPMGYNSVYGGVGSNSDEFVVYTNHAIRPSWLILYG